MDTPDIIACIFVGGLFGFAIDYVSGRKRAKERAEMVEKAALSEAELREWWQQAKTITVQVGGERIVFTREPRSISEEETLRLIDAIDKGTPWHGLGHLSEGD